VNEEEEKLIFTFSIKHKLRQKFCIESGICCKFFQLLLLFFF
jgi:hypothetical protein